METHHGSAQGTGIWKRNQLCFTSDNGGAGGVTSNYPLRGNKGNFFERGLRVPFKL